MLSVLSENVLNQRKHILCVSANCVFDAVKKKSPVSTWRLYFTVCSLKPIGFRLPIGHVSGRLLSNRMS